MGAMGAVRLKEVDEAQAAIVAIAKALSDSGEIVIGHIMIITELGARRTTSRGTLLTNI